MFAGWTSKDQTLMSNYKMLSRTLFCRFINNAKLPQRNILMVWRGAKGGSDREGN